MGVICCLLKWVGEALDQALMCKAIKDFCTSLIISTLDIIFSYSFNLYSSELFFLVLKRIPKTFSYSNALCCFINGKSKLGLWKFVKSLWVRFQCWDLVTNISVDLSCLKAIPSDTYVAFKLHQPCMRGSSLSKTFPHILQASPFLVCSWLCKLK